MNKVLVMVECISQFRVRYCIEAPADHPEYALDTIVTDDVVKEFSQLHLGQVVVSNRVVSEEEALKIYNEDNPSFDSWSDAQKLKVSVTTLEDQGYDTIEHSEYYYDTERHK